MKTNEEIIEQALAMAARFYSIMGYQSKPGFKFYDSRHPTELMCWYMAVDAFNELAATDVNDALDEINDD